MLEKIAGRKMKTSLLKTQREEYKNARKKMGYSIPPDNRQSTEIIIWIQNWKANVQKYPQNKILISRISDAA